MSFSLAADLPEIGHAIARLDVWLETMRGPAGYTGPISHWWESSLLFCGPMADWRYEGIVGGYVALYQATREAVWLERARRAADDLVVAQMPAGTYRSSSFQQGPMEGGTPHEAAADVALLELALLLRGQGDAGWESYARAASRNVEGYLLGALWTGAGFRDQPWHDVLVPNKNGTTIEALVLFERLTGRDMSLYLDRAAEVILQAQVADGPTAGATVHSGTGRHLLAIGIYTARSMCALLALHERRPQQRLVDAVSTALEFLRTLMTPNGIHLGRYPDGSLIANPRLVAGAGDLLRLATWARRHDLAQQADVDRLAAMLVAAQSASGAIPTGFGFARRGSRRPYEGKPEFRDVLPVVGWCDKAFRALCLLVPAGSLARPNAAPANATSADVRIDCTWKGRDCTFTETTTRLALHDASNGTPLYSWQKAACYPDTYRL